MAFLKKLLIIVAALIALLVIAGQFMPTELRVERSTVIGASRLAVFETVSNFENFNKFSPWHQIDPNTQYEYSAKRSGVGASMKWFSEHKDVGNGEQRIVSVSGAERIEMELEFDGWDGISTSWYELEDVAEGTQVTWGYQGDVSKPFFIRFLAPMIKGQLEQMYDDGLTKLKTLHENQSGGMTPTAEPALAVAPKLSHETVSAQTVVFVKGRSAYTADEIARNLGMAYQKVVGFINTNGLSMTGMPMALDTVESKIPTLYVFEAAIPVADDTPDMLATDTIGIKQTYAGPVVKAVHTGPYTRLSAAYAAIETFMAENQLQSAGPSWEHYISDPGDVVEDELITHVYMPVN